MQDSLQRAFWAFYSPIALALGFAMLGLLCAFWMPFAFGLNLVLPVRQRHLIGRLAINIGLKFYVLFLQAFCGCRFNISATSNELERSSGVLIANHPSLLDALILLSIVPNIVCVMKSSLLDNPLFGASARLAGFIRNSDPFAMIAHGKEVLGEGANLLLFPEGTRSVDDRKVSPFNSSVAILSWKLDLPIRTFLITYDQSYLGKSHRFPTIPKLPMKVSVRVGKVFAPSNDYTAKTKELESYFNGELHEEV
ncbi:MAG: lysophospholipid acyltransferase family protein [Fluviibacter sp.]